MDDGCSCSLLCKDVHMLCLHCLSCSGDCQCDICVNWSPDQWQLLGFKAENGASTSSMGASVELVDRTCKSSIVSKGAGE